MREGRAEGAGGFGPDPRRPIEPHVRTLISRYISGFIFSVSTVLRLPPLRYLRREMRDGRFVSPEPPRAIIILSRALSAPSPFLSIISFTDNKLPICINISTILHSALIINREELEDVKCQRRAPVNFQIINALGYFSRFPIAYLTDVLTLYYTNYAA